MGGDVLAKNKNYKVYSGADKASPEKVYFDELKFTDVQRQAYLDARTQYYKESDL